MRILLFLLLTAAVGVRALVNPVRTAPSKAKDCWDETSFQPTLFQKHFATLPNLVSPEVLAHCSCLATQAFEENGGHYGTYLEKPWKNSRIYVDAQQLWTPEDAAYFDPILRHVRRTLALQMGLVSDSLPAEWLDFQCAQAMPLEAAFTNYYVGVGNAPRDMLPHVDFNNQGTPVPLSVVVQGIYDNGADSQILGKLDCWDKEGSKETVCLRAGDGLVLAGAEHKPHPVPDNAKRLAFVMFFSELNFVR